MLSMVLGLGLFALQLFGLYIFSTLRKCAIKTKLEANALRIINGGTGAIIFTMVMSFATAMSSSFSAIF